MESNSNYREVFITLSLSKKSNQLLSESAKRSNRKKVQEAKLRLEDHLNQFRSISELNYAISNQKSYTNIKTKASGDENGK